MVKSILDTSITYSESQLIEADDHDLDASMYIYDIDDISIIIALGNKRYTYIGKGIMYVPVYLVHNDRIITQIGVFEFMADNLPNLLDKENDLDVGKLDPILFYKEATPDYLKKFHSQEAEGDKKDEEDEEEEEEKGEGEYLGDNWMQSFMNSSKYGIRDNEGMGDCLFAAIRDAYKYVSKDWSISTQRKLLAQNVTPAIFETYKKLYTDSVSSLNETKREIETLSSEYQQCRTDLSGELDRQRQKDIVKHAKDLQHEHARLEKTARTTKNIVQEYQFMQDVDDIVAFKDILQSCNFWGDTWAISTLEMALNVKLVLFSSAQYHAYNHDNILTCGQINDELSPEFVFSPGYYIMLEYTGRHYKLITYDNHGIFTFDGLPKKIKQKIVNKCMQQDAGLYSYIEDFKKLAKNMYKEDDIDQEASLYDATTVFQFHSKSNDKVKPGKGIGETILTGTESEFLTLAAIPEWRKKLSNSWYQPFELDGHNWASVEHYYQGSKFRKDNPKFYVQFSLDSNSELSKDAAMAKGAGEKAGKFKGKIVRPKDIIIDQDFSEERETQAAMYAKFSQNEELGKLLDETKQAKLQHFVRASPAVVFNDLMRVRQRLRKKKR